MQPNSAQSWTESLTEPPHHAFDAFKKAFGTRKDKNQKVKIGSVPLNERVKVKIPHCRIGDLIGLILAILLFIPMLIVYPLLLIASLPMLICVKFYVTCHKKPMRMVQRGCMFWFFKVLCLLVSLLWIFIAVFYMVLVILVTHVFTLPYAIISCKSVRNNMKLLKPFRRIGARMGFEELLVSVIGASYRQGFFEFWFKFPSIFTYIPIMKYCFCTNMFLHNISEVWCNQWTLDVPLPAHEASALLLKYVSYSLHIERDREDIDEDKFAAHYPFPPANRADKTVMGLQFETYMALLVNTVFDQPDSSIKSETGIHSIFQVYLHYWNPCHIFTGYVEVNTMAPKDGSSSSCRFEHPMWCMFGNTYFGLKTYNDVNALFFNSACTEVPEFIRDTAQTDVEIGQKKAVPGPAQSANGKSVVTGTKR